MRARLGTDIFCSHRHVIAATPGLWDDAGTRPWISAGHEGMEDQSVSASPDHKSGSAADAYNQRTYTRYDWKHRVQVAWLTDHLDDCHVITLNASDIGAGGMALMSRCMVHPGQCGIVLLGLGKTEPIIRGIEVCHCRYDVRIAQHVIGCSWTPIPPHYAARARNTESGFSLAIELMNVPPARHSDAPNAADDHSPDAGKPQAGDSTFNVGDSSQPPVSLDADGSVSKPSAT
jgi:hypothetical protein